MVCDGVYTGFGNRDVDFRGKAITVRSANGPDTCIIDCQASEEDPHRGFYFHSGETPAAVVEGFTITNGYFAGADMWEGGGGICCREGSSPTIVNCTITACYGKRGGAILAASSAPKIIDCTIVANTGPHGGGLCFLNGANATVINCTVTGNVGAYGGGVHVNGASPTINSCVITANRGSAFGGGVACFDGAPRITNCTLVGNTGVNLGGGGVYVLYGFPSIANCILWDNTPDQIGVEHDGPTVTYSVVQNGWSGEGNIDADPGFAFADDLHLMAESPCVDAGTNDPPGGLPPSDLDGNSRPLDGDGDMVAIADMGAYEFNPGVPSIAVWPAEIAFYGPEGGPNPDDQILSIRNCGGGTLNWEVAEDCDWLEVDPISGQSTGEIDEVFLQVDTTDLVYGTYACELTISDPAAANNPRTVAVMLYVVRTLRVPSEFATIQAAIDAAVDGVTVLVADGVYTGTGNKDLDFGGKAIAVRSENGPENCIIDCQYAGRGFHFHSGETADAVVDGFTITNGYIGDSGGIGIRCSDGSSPTIANCVITGNAGKNGGGIHCAASAPTITDCTIAGNTAIDYGGGVSAMNSALTITNCTIRGNSAGISGGGLRVYGDYDLTLTNCAITGNNATNGGGISCYGCTPAITNCTVSGNTAVLYGGAVYTEDASPWITNCILWGNGPDEISTSGDGGPTVTYSDVQSGWPGEGNIDAEPLFVDPENDDYHLSPGSPCIDAGCNWSVPLDIADLDDDGNTDELTPLDLDGEGRFFDDPDTPNYGCCGEGVVVDMGAYEYGGTGPQPCPGDLDGDQDVDHSDLGILLSCWGCDCGDLDCSGHTDQADLGILLAHWGEGCP